MDELGLTRQELEGRCKEAEAVNRQLQAEMAELREAVWRAGAAGLQTRS